MQHAQRYQAQVNLADARRDYERKDALLLVRRLLAARAERVAPPAGWRFAETPVWKAAFQPA